MKYNGLVAGLGNPGARYDGTRHNMGFLFIDALLDFARRSGHVKELAGKKYSSLLWEISCPETGGTWLAAKPQTYMNDSGAAIRPLLRWHNLEPEQLVVAQDELDIPAGRIRFKFGGGLAGHNGLASIAAQLGSRDFYRLRIGIGKAPQKDNTIDWVLGKPAPDDQAKISGILPLALETFFIFCRHGAARTMEFAHAASPEQSRLSATGHRI